MEDITIKIAPEKITKNNPGPKSIWQRQPEAKKKKQSNRSVSENQKDDKTSENKINPETKEYKI